MCQRQRPTTAWNNRGQFINGDVSHCVSFLSVSFPCPNLQLVYTELSGLVHGAAISGLSLFCVFSGPTFLLLWAKTPAFGNQLLLALPLTLADAHFAFRANLLRINLLFQGMSGATCWNTYLFLGASQVKFTGHSFSPYLHLLFLTWPTLFKTRRWLASII